jgi:uncharacterized protein with HEPN domain
MSKHDPRLSLQQMIDNAEKAELLVQEMAYQDFLADWRTQLMVERLIEIIGEAANRLPDELRDQYPAMPWRQMIGTRNWLAHGYDAVDYQIIWDVLTQHLALVRAQAIQMLRDLDVTE